MGHLLTAGQQFDAIIESVQQEAPAAALALGFEYTSRQKLCRRSSGSWLSGRRILLGA
jgi:hypothetical protein